MIDSKEKTATFDGRDAVTEPRLMVDHDASGTRFPTVIPHSARCPAQLSDAGLRASNQVLLVTLP